MSATDELRRLLDERGVEYEVDEEYAMKYPPTQKVTWSSIIAGDDMTITAQDYCIGTNEDGSEEYCLDLEFHQLFTPEQAIAATLERKTCRIVEERASDTDAYWEYTLVMECGAEFIWAGSDYPICCPYCGGKVVK